MARRRRGATGEKRARRERRAGRWSGGRREGRERACGVAKQSDGAAMAAIVAAMARAEEERPWQRNGSNRSTGTATRGCGGTTEL